MTVSSGRPNDQTPWITPYLMVKDVNESMAFYEKAFGMEKRDIANAEDGTAAHGELKYQGQLLMIGKEGGYGGTSRTPTTSGIESPITLYLYCENVDSFHEKAVNAGAESLGMPMDSFWGDRFCRLKCPNGYIWLFATHMTQ